MKSTESGGSKRLGQSLSGQCKFGAGRAHAPGMRDMRGALGAPAAPPCRPPFRPRPAAPPGPAGPCRSSEGTRQVELERVELRRKPLPHTSFLCDTPTLLPLGLPDSVAKPASRAQHAAVSAADERASAPAACGRSDIWWPPGRGAPTCGHQRSRERTRVSVIPGSLGNAIRQSILIKHRQHERL